jgi:hypothetical protein
MVEPMAVATWLAWAAHHGTIRAWLDRLRFVVVWPPLRRCQASEDADSSPATWR